MREFRQHHGRGGERYWRIDFVDPETITTEWGHVKDGVRGKPNRTKDKPGPKGKEGTKAWMSAADNAVFSADRLIRKKLEEGYVEVGLDGNPLVGGAADSIDFTTAFPKNLCFSKPRNTMSDSTIKKWDKAEDLVFTRKINGMMVIVQASEDGTRIYSRRMDDLTDHFPHLCDAMKNLPPNSILLFEAFWGDGNIKRDLLEVQSIMRSKAPLAIEKQQERGWMKFYLIRVPVWKGECREHIYTCGDQVEWIDETFADTFLDYDHSYAGKFLRSLEIFEGTYDEALEEAELGGYEGWVAYQRSGSMDGMSFSFNGKPTRPKCCFKVKSMKEDDFICYWDPEDRKDNGKQGSWGSGKNSSRVGTFSMYQLDSEGNEIYICEVGSGLTDAQRDEYADVNLFPLVAEVQYASRSYVSEGDKTNALEFPSVARIREDKLPQECVNDKIKSPAS
jgi:hypothetical protein